MHLTYVHGNYIDSEMANVVQVMQMCQAFTKCGIDVTLAIGEPQDSSLEPTNIAETHLSQVPLFKIVTYRKFTFAGKFGMLGNYFGVKIFLKNIKTDFCFARDPLIFQLCLQAGFPTVFEAHRAKLHGSLEILSKLWARSIVMQIDNPNFLKFITISKALSDTWHAQGIPEEKLLALHDGFNTDTFGKIEDQGKARNTLNLPLDKKIIVYTGNLKPDRGIERIIKLAKTFPEVLFVIVGGPEDRKEHFQEIAERNSLSNTIWTGHVPHASVPRYLHAADILLMLWTWQVPTIMGCSPLKLFEYMAAERIIVGEAFPTISEVVDEQTAFLAEPENFEELCEKISFALEQSLPSKMASKARELAIREYTWERRAQKILDSIDELI